MTETIAKTRWKLCRVGFFNFWYYDQEEFRFSKGKMLLRGHNGSGKSVTMQSTFPFLLDGNKSPERLDPFNSKDRSMHDYLCGEKEINGVEDRIGYLFVEYKKPGVEKYFTTGVGLQAKTGTKDVDFWGFIVLDNQRVNKEGGILLYQEGIAGNHKRPLTKRELTRMFKEQECGYVATTHKEYMDLVNKHLFGFDNLESFQHLIKLMVLLRSPKLSKDFKIQHMNEILTESLPELTHEELLPFTDTIENLDQIDEKIREYGRSQTAVGIVDRVYRKYNRLLLSEKARNYLQTNEAWQVASKKYHNLEQQFAETEQKLTETSAQLIQLQAEEGSLKDRQRMLQSNEVFSLEVGYQNLRAQLEQVEQQIKNTEDSHANKKKVFKQQQEALETYKAEIREIEKEMRETEGELSQCALEAAFDRHQLELEQFRRDFANGSYSFEGWKHSAQLYRTRIREIAAKISAEQLAKSEYQKANDELSRLVEKIEHEKREQQQSWMFFEEEKQGFLDLFQRWVSENKQLTFRDEDINRVQETVRLLYEQCEFEEIQAIVAESYENRRHTLQKRILDLQQEQNRLEEQRSLLEQELQAWKYQKDPEPLRHVQTQHGRIQLQREGIAFVPLYSAVDFRDEVRQEVRHRLEHALLETGLLDALIVSEKDRERAKVSDRVLSAGTHARGTTLGAYLIPVPNDRLPESEIDKVLGSIAVNTGANEFFVSEDGSYKMGILEGVAPDLGHSQYIGKEAREKYRKQMISKLNGEIVSLQKEISGLSAQEQIFSDALEGAKKEKDECPSEKPMKSLYKQWEEKSRECSRLGREHEEKEKTVKGHEVKWKEVRHALLEMSEDVPLEKSTEAFEFARQFFDEYMDYLGQLELKCQRLGAVHRSSQQMNSILEETILDINRIMEMLKAYDAEREKTKLSAEALEALLKEKGVDNLREEIASIENRLTNVQQDAKQKLVAQTRLESKLQQLEAYFDAASKHVRFYERLVGAWQEVFAKEVGYRFAEEIEDVVFTYDTAIPLAEKIADQFPISDVSLDQLKSDLKDAFHEVRDGLIGYQLDWNDVETVPTYQLDTYEDELLYSKLKELNENTRRTMITLDLFNRTKTPSEMYTYFGQCIEDSRRNLSEKEQELFREVLFNNIGQKIRNRINKVDEWVNEMNKRMKEQENSLKIQLKWKVKQDFIQAGGTNVMELFRRDPKTLTDEAMEQLTQYFAEKIRKAKLLLQEERKDKALKTLHQIVRETLDYRRWYEFVMYGQRKGEELQELTQKRFNKYSGGEKAMSMYIPLFTAMYSRYSDAREDAPRIITLDEAFAGVDHGNIKEMFALVEELGFDFIMNSQILWGDYDTVPSIAIYELIHPHDSPVVAIERYIWDGMTLKRAEEDDYIA